MPCGFTAPFTEFLHETDAIADGNQNHFHPGIAGDRVIEGTDRSDVLVVREITDHVAALQCVVQQDQASWPQAGQHLFVVLGVAGLVGVDEREACHAARAIEVHSWLMSQHSKRPPGPRLRATARAE